MDESNKQVIDDDIQVRRSEEEKKGQGWLNEEVREEEK